MKVTLIKDSMHGDFKTAVVFPERWPPLKKGDEVEVLGSVFNFYGRFIRVISDKSNHEYDIPIDGFNPTELEKALTVLGSSGHGA